jgi:hypothetical protein
MPVVAPNLHALKFVALSAVMMFGILRANHNVRVAKSQPELALPAVVTKTIAQLAHHAPVVMKLHQVVHHVHIEMKLQHVHHALAAMM